MVIPPIAPVPSSVASGDVRPAASRYAPSISPTAEVRNEGAVAVHGSGPAASTEKIVPVTSVHVTKIAAPVIGLEPTSPVMAEA